MSPELRLFWVRRLLARARRLERRWQRLFKEHAEVMSMAQAHLAKVDKSLSDAQRTGRSEEAK